MFITYSRIIGFDIVRNSGNDPGLKEESFVDGPFHKAIDHTRYHDHL